MAKKRKSKKQDNYDFADGDRYHTVPDEYRFIKHGYTRDSFKRPSKGRKSRKKVKQ